MAAQLKRKPVGKGNSLTIDRCAHCSGVWLDAQEWEILTRHGLHEHLHEVLDSEWQEELTRVDRIEAEQARHLRLLGAEDLRRIQEMRDWLDSHPKKSELYAYLQHSSRL